MARVYVRASEAEEILEYVLHKQGVTMAALDETLRLNAVIGAINVIGAMQELGWRVARPLVDASYED